MPSVSASAFIAPDRQLASDFVVRGGQFALRQTENMSCRPDVRAGALVGRFRNANPQHALTSMSDFHVTTSSSVQPSNSMRAARRISMKSFMTSAVLASLATVSTPLLMRCCSMSSVTLLTTMFRQAWAWRSGVSWRVGGSVSQNALLKGLLSVQPWPS